VIEPLPRRIRAFLRRTTLLDRIASGVIILWGAAQWARAFRISVPLSSFLGFLSFVAAVYFLFRILPWVRNRVLWRLRNRLIVTYVFIGVVPVILLLTMVGVAADLLYLELGAHLLHDDLQERIDLISADGDAIAGALALELRQGASPSDANLLSRPAAAGMISAAQESWSGLQAHLNQGEHLVRLGNGRHFAGFVESEGNLCFAAANQVSGKSGSLFLVTEAPLTPALLDGLTSELGPIQMVLFQPTNEKPVSGLVYENQGRFYVAGQQVASRRRSLTKPAHRLDLRVNGASIFEAVRMKPDKDSTTAPVLASFALRPSALNRRLFTSVGALGPALVTVLVVVGVVFLLLEAAALATGVVLTRTITRSVGDLYEGTLHVRQGDFSHRIRVRTRDQLGALGDSFNEMTSSISELIEEQGKRQRLENELSIAREVQNQLFPRSLPALPGLELAAICKPARTVSGDYYDFIQIGPSRIAIALADISGKGISAALLMASLQAALRSQAMLDGHGGTATLVSRLNQHLFRNTSDDRYATFFIAVYDTESKTLTYTNAGHLPPFFVLNGRVQTLGEGGTVVGLFEDSPYDQGVVPVAPGSVLVAFSDGLTEPENVYGEQFGLERLRDEVVRQQASSPNRLAEGLIAASEQWAGAAEQADDITVVVARMG
jgi:phosphoserine phosphatase RsbU/P